MRRHRAAMNEENQQHHQSPASSTLSSPPPREPVVNNSNTKSTINGSKRVWGLDLNLTPMENDDLEFGLGKMVAAPAAVDCI